MKKMPGDGPFKKEIGHWGNDIGVNVNEGNAKGPLGRVSSTTARLIEM